MSETNIIFLTPPSGLFRIVNPAGGVSIYIIAKLFINQP